MQRFEYIFFPILAGRLIVVLKHAGKNYSLNAETLDDLLKKSRYPESPGMLGLLDLTYDLYSLSSEEILALLPPEFDKW